MDLWRFLDTGYGDAYWNMALDEAILTLRAEERTPETLRVYTWKPSAVSIGYFQSLEQEVDLNACKSLGVDVVRRITGGGAVYHECGGELTYSLVVGEDTLRSKRFFKDIQGSYRVICEALVEGLRKIGINAEFKPINDIVVNGKKISGNAQTRRRGVILQHGTILLRTDIPTMFKVLKVSKEKISDKAIKAVEDRVTTIYREVSSSITLEDIKDALRRGFSEYFNTAIEPSPPTQAELELASEYRKRFASWSWIAKR
ncbi:MAG: biotin/lipoate A/B protein ligase family protein [Nitrososphaerales archaeon]